MLVKEIMTTDLHTLTSDNTVKEAANLMLDKNISIIPVIDSDNKLLGVVTQSDFIGKKVEVPHAIMGIKQIFGETFHSKNVEDVFAAVRDKKLGDVMTTNLKTVTPEETLNHVLNVLINNNLKRIPVVEGDQLVGVITRRDIMKAFAKKA